MSGVNDFVVSFATVNGSGSASANGIFARAIFRMGVPVSPKNVFPSNIQGLPTWYEVRVSGEGWLARREGIDLMVAMNPQSYARDVAAVVPGGWLMYDSTMPRDCAAAVVSGRSATPISQRPVIGCLPQHHGGRRCRLSSRTAPAR